MPFTLPTKGTWVIVAVSGGQSVSTTVVVRCPVRHGKAPSSASCSHDPTPRSSSCGASWCAEGLVPEVRPE